MTIVENETYIYSELQINNIISIFGPCRTIICGLNSDNSTKKELRKKEKKRKPPLFSVFLSSPHCDINMLR